MKVSMAEYKNDNASLLFLLERREGLGVCLANDQSAVRRRHVQVEPLARALAYLDMHAQNRHPTTAKHQQIHN